MKVLNFFGKVVVIVFRFICAGLMIIMNGVMNLIGYLIALIAK